MDGVGEGSCRVGQVGGARADDAMCGGRGCRWGRGHGRGHAWYWREGREWRTPPPLSPAPSHATPLVSRPLARRLSSSRARSRTRGVALRRGAAAALSSRNCRRFSGFLLTLVPVVAYYIATGALGFDEQTAGTFVSGVFVVFSTILWTAS